MKTQIGESLTCDFEENTWTFEMEDNFEVTAGEFMIIPKDLFKQQIIDAYNNGWQYGFLANGNELQPTKNSETYYSETFEADKETLK